MKNLGFLTLFFLCFDAIAQTNSKGSHYWMMLSGGDNLQSNAPRYYYTMKSMYQAFQSNGAKSEEITFLYGSGDLKDTKTGPEVILDYAPEFESRAASQPSMESTGTGVGIALAHSEQSSGGVQVQVMNKIDPADLYNNKDMFGVGSRSVDGPAKKNVVVEKLNALKRRMKPNDNLTLFITDHGELNKTTNESMVVLWGEKISTSELRKLLNEFPDSIHIRIMSNMCFGGGLAELTSKNICVFANQEKWSPSRSYSSHQDVYGSSLAKALKDRIDFNNDGKITYLDAHHYASSKDNFTNKPTDSLEWFFRKNEQKILSLAKIDSGERQECSVASFGFNADISSLITHLQKKKSLTDKLTKEEEVDALRELEQTLTKHQESPLFKEYQQIKNCLEYEY